MPILELGATDDDTFVNVSARAALHQGNSLDIMLVQFLLGEALDRPRSLQAPPKFAVDGNFGPITQAGVRLFQHRFGLGSDGIVDKARGSAAQISRFVIFQLNQKFADRDPIGFQLLLNAAVSPTLLLGLLKPVLPTRF